MIEIKITPVNKKDTQKIIEVLFAAFEQDPLMLYFFGNEYQNLAKYVMQYLCNLAHLTNSPILGAFTKGELKGVALITPPKIVIQDRQKAIALADEQLAIAVSPTAIARIETYFQIMEANKPKQPHFYIDILGVMPESQGQGVGKALLEAVHKMSESSPQSGGVALDTENDRNLGFYKSLGYSVSTITNLDRLKVWSMFRSKII